jgi:hypothetical protein
VIAATDRAVAAPVRGRRGTALIVAMLVAAIGAATVAAAVVGDGSIAVVLTPIGAALALWMIWIAPLRRSLLVLIFFGLALDKPGDTEGLWQSPVAHLGGLLILNLNKSIDVPALSVSLLQVLLAYLVMIRMFRALSSVPRYEAGARLLARPMLGALAASWAMAIGLSAYGVARGGDVQMCKIQLQVFLPLLIVAYLLGVSLRGLRDYKSLAIVVVAAACVKALMAIWVRLTLPVVFGEGPGQLSYATTHGDSMLFAAAAGILVALFFERPNRRPGRLLLLIAPVLFAGMIANNRRLVWVELAACFLVLLAMNPRGRATRALIRTVVYAAPVLLIYGAAGWNSGSRVFAPVHLVRSMGDSNIDRSTLYRDGENYNLIYTFKANPLLGTGFGHPFEEAVMLDDISRNFKEWRYLPHNSILGLWAFAGGIGFTGLWLAFIVGLLLAARSYRFATSPETRAAAAVAMTTIVVYTVHCWGDIGFTTPGSVFLVGAALAIAGQLAPSTGAWPGTAGRPSPAIAA